MSMKDKEQVRDKRRTSEVSENPQDARTPRKPKEPPTPQAPRKAKAATGKKASQKRTAKGSRGVPVMDIVVILLITASIIGLVLRWGIELGEQEKKQKGAPYTVSFTVVETHRDIAGGINARDCLYISETGMYIGYMKDKLQITPVIGHPNRVTAAGSAVCEGELRDGALLLPKADVALAPGTELEVRTERARLTLRVTGIEPAS